MLVFCMKKRSQYVYVIDEKPWSHHLESPRGVWGQVIVSGNQLKYMRIICETTISERMLAKILH